MFAPLTGAIATIAELILNMVQLLVIASVIISWVGADPNNQIVRMIHSLTEPMYRPLRRLTRNLPGPIDWAPMLVLLIVIFLMVGVVPYIRMLGGAAPMTAPLPG
jgi:YggT family protein